MEETTIFGRYLSDVFLIEFPPHVQIIDNDHQGININIKNQRDFAVFIHEYWHYLMNISTVVRFRDFSIWHQLIPIFSKTLMENEDGTALGEEISEKDKIHLEEYSELWYAYNTHYFEGLKGNDILDYNFVGGFITTNYHLKLRGKDVPFQKIKIPVEVTTERGKERAFFYLGNIAIEESIANSVEKMIYDNGNKPPIIPYLVLKKLSEYFNNGQALSNYELAALGTLSFLTTNPALSLKYLFTDYLDLRKKYNIIDSLEIICDDIKSTGLQELREALLNDLQGIQNTYKNREPMAQALDYVAQRMKAAINLRLENPLFDLTPFETSVVNQEKLYHLRSDLIPSCDIKQVFKGHKDQIMKDIICPMDRTPILVQGHELYPSYLMRILHCQVHYFKAHWAGTIGRLQDSNNAISECPYYTTCRVSFRINSPETCKTKPWATFSQKHQNCAYGSAVGVTMGETKLRPPGNN